MNISISSNVDEPSQSSEILLSGAKRTRDIFEPESNHSEDTQLSERPAKVLKTDQSDFLRNHLPEIIDSRERDSGGAHLPLLNFGEQIVEQSKHENIIVTLPSTKSPVTLIVDVMSWAIKQERERVNRLPETSRLLSRTVLILVEDTSFYDQYSSSLLNTIENALVGIYLEEDHQLHLETWSTLLKNDIILTTSQLLLDSLVRGALTITQIHFLVITDAQNIRNQDSHFSMPIVRVMNEFYRISDSLLRPRIFSLVFYPSEQPFHFDSKTLKLEQTLLSKVFGVSDQKREEILALPDRPSEVVILYDTGKKFIETCLLKQLHLFDPTESIFRRQYRDSRYALDEVGSCASDLVWRRALKDIEAGLIPGHEDFDEDDLDVSETDRLKAKMYTVVKNWSFAMPNLDPSSRGFNVSHKFLRLVQVLSTFKAHGDGFRGIIFVQKREIAMVLADLLRTIDDRFLRPQAIVGGQQQEDLAKHQEIFHDFAIGMCNLLVATKSVEDLDVPKASVVIRYDLFESQISHAYVRARTRGRESHLVHMAERGNDSHLRILSRITNIGGEMLRWTERLCNFPESSTPPETLRETINPYHSDSEDEGGIESSETYVKDPTTNGRIYQQDATTVVYRYAASVRSKIDISENSLGLFKFKDIHKYFDTASAYVCTIDLPGTPIDRVCGEPASSKAQSRRSACFKACQTLYSSGVLDCRIVPLPYSLRAQYDYESKKPHEKEALQDVKTSGTRAYSRKRPTFWTNSPIDVPSTLYPTIIRVSTQQSPEFGPLLLVTKVPLPELPSFRLFSSGTPLPITFEKARPMELDEGHIKAMHSFTERLCRAIMNKPLVCPLEDMPYFFLPLPYDLTLETNGKLDLATVVEAIPWETVTLAGKSWAVPIKAETPEELEADMHDAVIQDRWIEFTRRFRVVKVRRDLTPLSKPLDSPREMHYNSLFDFCKSKRKGQAGLKDFNQPIAEVTKIHAVMNHLTPFSKPPASSMKSSAKYLIPELCGKFTIPASTLATGLLLPSIMRRIDDFLLVKELDAKFFDHAIREDLLHNAICTPSAGLEYDYERLELLGDAFLKYLSSVYVFVTSPSLSEGALHVVRQKIISNKSLLIHSTRVGLPPYIQSKVFLYKSWHPPNFLVRPLAKSSKHGTKNQEESTGGNAEDKPQEVVEEGEVQKDNKEGEEIADDPTNDPQEQVGTIEPDSVSEPLEPTAEAQTVIPKKKKKKKSASEEQNVQWLGDKAIADVTEAIIGAAYISGGREAALQATKAFTLPLANIDRWSDFGRKVLTPPPNVIAKLQPGSIDAIETIVGHKFNRPHLLAQAMTHSSIQGYESTSYERLEFIGDAILDFMVIRHIFDRNQQLSPGGLTMLKGAMVSNSTLAAVCVWSGLHGHLLYESEALGSSIEAYIGDLQERKQREYARADREGRSPGQYWSEIEPPKALSDVIESIIGAIYISDGFSPAGAENLFDNVLKPFYDKHITLQTLSHHPTKVLFELLQAEGCQQFEITKEKDEKIIRCHVIVHDVILSSAEDGTPTSAARYASLSALDALEGDPNFMTRTCDCRTHINHKKLKKKNSFEEALERALAEGIDDEDNEFGMPYPAAPDETEGIQMATDVEED